MSDHLSAQDAGTGDYPRNASNRVRTAHRRSQGYYRLRHLVRIAFWCMFALVSVAGMTLEPLALR